MTGFHINTSPRWPAFEISKNTISATFLEENSERLAKHRDYILLNPMTAEEIIFSINLNGMLIRSFAWSRKSFSVDIGRILRLILLISRKWRQY